ncbi:MAG: hypothetical protein MUF13_14650, partial [Akkermansiaceae bacterium]|nr:hypothetical protein [Akkermansiaceae bacterium]
PNNTGQFVSREDMARFHGNGTLDTAFDPRVFAVISSTVSSMALQTDGRILLGGEFDALVFTGRHDIARTSANGTADSFDPNPNSVVFAVAQKANGMALLGGVFTALQPNGASSPTARNLYSCVFNDPATQTLTVPGSTQALWTRSGACPELIWATFEVGPTANGPWGPPVFATRVATTSNWQASSLSLPASGFIRARGRTIGGIGSASSGLVEQIGCFPGTDLPLWRMFYFGSSANSGNGGNSADPDHDGVANIVEFAFGLNPNSGSSLQPPPAVLSGGNLSFTFTQPTGVSCINYGAEWSTDLIQWFPIPDTGSGNTRAFSVPIGTNPKMFLRHRITEH